MKLSILIPCYNWDVLEFIRKIHKLCVDEKRITQFEIICFEDASSKSYSNYLIKKLKHVKHLNLSENIGRSAIRNKLGEASKYNWLLFIDCDSKIVNNNFIQEYINATEQKGSLETVFYGSTMYEKKNNDITKTLHHKYGSQIETKRKLKIFSSHHFLIHKSKFGENKFDETIKTYGYEDTLFSISSNLKFKYINNPLIHTGLKTNTVFLEDTQKAIYNLTNYTNQIKTIKYIKVLKWGRIIEKLKISKIILIIFNIMESKIVENLKSESPKIILFQLYKLGLLIKLKSKKLKKIQ
ncbi:glycosyltransferase [Flavobacteriales bacterium]|nr:glycosyltransferase [Flavobacteriales bacterium]